MNKILHDSKMGLTPLVESLPSEVNSVILPSLTTVQSRLNTLEQSTLPALQNEQKIVINPAIRKLQTDLMDPVNGVELRL